MNTVAHDPTQRTPSDSRSLRDRVRGTTTPPSPPPDPKRPLRQVEPEHLELARLAAEACARRFFDEMAATESGLMRFDRERFAEAIQQAAQEAVSQAWRGHPAIRARSPFTRDRAAS
ncbi:MAG: hypothetical protein M3R02_20665 [Chloroflexota bacterium]|nr:hypothetical protein [Chloroflexota bacterium]